MIQIKDFDLTRDIKKQDLLDILRSESSDIHITDIMKFYVHLVADGQYVQEHYKKDYIHAYVNGFLLRVKEIKDDENHYPGFLDKDNLKKALELFNEQENVMMEQDNEINRDPRLFKIYKIISLYTTFILDEPIHIVGTVFPGGFKVKYENKTYYCPVKESQQDNPHAVCGFCIAEQDESV